MNIKKTLKILITGGTGFIGRNLKEQFVDIYQIVAPTSSELNLHDSEHVSDYLKDNKFDVVLHTATCNATKTSTKDRRMVLHDNLLMFYNIARCSSYFGKMINYGSGAEYHRYRLQPKVTEEFFDTIVPDDDYGLSKYIMAHHVAQSDNLYNLILFAVYGKYEDWRVRLISNACCRAIFDLPITIKQDVLFDYLYIDDLVNVTKWFIENKPSESSYNICSGKAYTLKFLAQSILKVAGKKLAINIRSQGLGPEYSGCNDKLIKTVGGYEFFEIESAITKLYNWYSGRKNELSINQLLKDN